MTKILLIAAIPFDGTSFYRGFGPFSHLQRHYRDIEIVNGNVKDFLFQWDTIMQSDVVVLQRPSQEYDLNIIKIAKQCRRPVLVDYDDDILHIPETNPRHGLYYAEMRQSIVKECLELADLITVSTPAIKQSYSEIVSADKIQVIPNGYDEDIFSDELYTGPRQKIIAWRGGDTHEKDLLDVKDQILRLIKKYPDYQWAFLGKHPEWVIQDLSIPREQIMLFGFQDIMTYYETLANLRPEIAIVPLEDNKFNHGKSNISAIEFTLTGAITIAPDWDKFRDTGCVVYGDDKLTLEDGVELIINSNLEQKRIYYEKALHDVKKFSLYNINKHRYDLIKSLAETIPQKIYPSVAQAIPFTPEESYLYCLKRGFIQENENYAKAHHTLAEWLQEFCKVESAVELGCGPGAIVEQLLRLNVVTTGIDMNEHMVAYFKQRNPVYEAFVHHGDFVKQFDAGEEIMDLVISIEVFEHIAMSDEEWNTFIKYLAEHFRWFYFTSTPYHTTETFDIQWGHVNIRRYEKWRELFESNGWKFHSNPQKIVPWDMLLKSELIK